MSINRFLLFSRTAPKISLTFKDENFLIDFVNRRIINRHCINEPYLHNSFIKESLGAKLQQLDYSVYKINDSKT